MEQSLLPEPSKPVKDELEINAGSPTLRLMVVDDNTDAADTACTILGLKGYQAKVCYSGHQALTLAAEFQPPGCPAGYWPGLISL
ncbi:MAG: response regulator, partial [Bacteroidia bacterium]|nr:response regulator [Bacteroidia bacterium]